jgi:RimJ/RimL family protein N-acetyltransferase
MRHTYKAEGYGVVIRPVELADAEFIVELRHAQHARGKLGDSSRSVADQQAWLGDYFDRVGDYYFIVETRDRIPIGTCGIYNHVGPTAECGRLIILSGVHAALGVVMLSFELAFGKLALAELRATSVASNLAVHSMIKKLGGRHISVDAGGRMISGQRVDILRFSMTRSDWEQNRARLDKIAHRAGKRVEWWSNHHADATRSKQGKRA